MRISNLRRLLLASAPMMALLALCACDSPPKRIDPTGQEAITGMGIDYSDAQEIAESLCRQMLASPDFMKYPQPVLARYNPTRNSSSDPNAPINMINARIRQTLNNSGQVQFTSALKTAEGHDPAVREARELADDPMFDQRSVAESGSMGRVQAPKLSIASDLMSAYTTDGSSKQKTYELVIVLTELDSGIAIKQWSSKAIAKVGKN